MKIQVEGNEADNCNGVEASNTQTNDGVSFTRLKSETGGKVRRALISNVKRVPVNPRYVPKSGESKQSTDDVEQSSHDSKPRHNDTDKSHRKESSQKDSTDRSHRKESSHRDSTERSHRKESSHRDSTDKSHRKDTSSSNSSARSHSKEPSFRESERKQEKKFKKPRRSAPPPMSFNELLKLAEQKSDSMPSVNPIKLPTKQKDPTEGRPMTQKEKDRLARTQSKEYQYWLKTGKRHPNMDPGLKPQLNSKNRLKGESSTGKSSDKNHVTSGSSSTAVNSRDGPRPNTTAKASAHPAAGLQYKSQSDMKSATSNSGRGSAASQSNGSRSSAAPQGNFSRTGASSASSKSPLCSASQSSRTPSAHGHSARGGGKHTPSLAASSRADSRPASTQGSSRRSSYDETNNNVIECGVRSQQSKVSTWDRIYGDVRRKQQLHHQRRPGTLL